MPKAILNQQQKKEIAREFKENNRKLDSVCYQLLKMVDEYKRVRKQSTLTFLAKKYGVSHQAISNYLLEALR